MARISVLMPVYNAENTLYEALDTIAEQTLQDYELIVVDDGSTDRSAQILNQKAQKDARIRVLLKPHSGIIESLNEGLKICQAPLVARMDADDRAHPERLEAQARYLAVNPEVVVAGCLVSAFPEHKIGRGFQIYLGWLNQLTSNAEIQREIFIESPLPHPSVMFRRKIIQEVGGYKDFGWAEDYDLWLRLYLKGHQFGKVPQVLMEWRDQAKRLTRRDPRYSVNNFLSAKAFYLSVGPLKQKDALFIWGAGMTGRRIGRYLQKLGLLLNAYVDVDPKKIGRKYRGIPIIAIDELRTAWNNQPAPALLAAVGARGARSLIRKKLLELGFKEGVDWWGVA